MKHSENCDSTSRPAYTLLGKTSASDKSYCQLLETWFDISLEASIAGPTKRCYFVCCSCSEGFAIYTIRFGRWKGRLSLTSQQWTHQSRLPGYARYNEKTRTRIGALSCEDAESKIIIYPVFRQKWGFGPVKLFWEATNSRKEAAPDPHTARTRPKNMDISDAPDGRPRTTAR